MYPGTRFMAMCGSWGWRSPSVRYLSFLLTFQHDGFKDSFIHTVNKYSTSSMPSDSNIQSTSNHRHGSPPTYNHLFLVKFVHIFGYPDHREESPINKLRWINSPTAEVVTVTAINAYGRHVHSVHCLQQKGTAERLRFRR